MSDVKAVSETVPATYHIIVNPISGHSTAPSFVQNHVEPLLTALHIPYHLHTTSGVRDAGRIARVIRAASHDKEAAGPIKVIVAAGDGTAHEMIEGILEEQEQTLHIGLGRWEIAVLPLGTANALHSSLFPPGSDIFIPPALAPYLTSTSPSDLHALASLLLALSDAPPRSLPITLTTLRDSAGVSTSTPAIPSHIVLSTAMHAGLLSDSEALRTSYPGLERFKVAAEKNIGVFFPANVQLLPASEIGAAVQQYNPRTDAWTDVYTTDGTASDGSVSLKGPFAYFLSTTTTPRLEPAFVISPLLQSHPPTGPTMDIIVLRPLRDPRIFARLDAGEGEAEIAQALTARSKEVFGWAYRSGGHVKLTYPPALSAQESGDGGDSAVADADAGLPTRDNKAATDDAEQGGPGAVVVETFRCGGFIWTPTDPTHEKSHIVCADGSLYTVPQGGYADVRVMPSGSGTEVVQHGFWVWG